MKAIIMVSSIFYLLGLKISNTIDIIKRPHPATDKIIVHEPTVLKKEKTIDITKSDQLKPVQDTVSGGGMTDKILESK